MIRDKWFVLTDLGGKYTGIREHSLQRYQQKIKTHHVLKA